MLCKIIKQTPKNNSRQHIRRYGGMRKGAAVVFPGQGAQYVGMCKDIAENFAVARKTIEEASDIAKVNFSKLMFEGPAEVLQLTENTQPVTLLHSMAILNVLKVSFL